MHRAQDNKSSILCDDDFPSTSMSKSRDWASCRSCAYWEPYPGWEGAGTCNQEMSRRYGRMAAGAADSCDQYVPSRKKPASLEAPRGASSHGTTCEYCHHWLPFGLIPRVGQCDNPASRHFRSSVFSDKPTEECFATRSLDGLEFMWCQSHRETIYSAELPDHRGCRVFVSSASLPVEDEMELTLAGE